MADLYVVAQGRIYRNRDGAGFDADGQFATPRLDRDHSVFMLPVLSPAQVGATEGTYFVAQTATPGTGITLTSATGTTYSDTNGIVGINNRALLGGKDVILDFVTLKITAAGTASTSSEVASRLDSGARVSVATQLQGYGAGGAASADGIAEVRGGAITIAAATNQVRNLGRAILRKAAAPAFIVDDRITLKFGDVNSVNAQAVIATTAIEVTLHLPAVVIPPQWSWVLNEWAPGRTAAQSAEIVVGYWVR